MGEFASGYEKLIENNRSKDGSEEEYYRLSLTNNCNFNCYFCHNEGNPKGNEEMKKETIYLLSKYAKMKGVSKLKLTGGEPLIRDDICDVVKGIKSIYPDSDLSMITNGSLLDEKAYELRKAGLDRVTVSLHSLEPRVFSEMVGASQDYLEKVLDGLEAAKEADFDKVKINSIITDYNKDEISDLVRFANEHSYNLRLLDVLPVNQKAEETRVDNDDLRGMLREISSYSEEIVEDRTQLTRFHTPYGSVRLKGKVGSSVCEDCSEKNECEEGICAKRFSPGDGEGLFSDSEGSEGESALASELGIGEKSLSYLFNLPIITSQIGNSLRGEFCEEDS